MSQVIMMTEAEAVDSGTQIGQEFMRIKVGLRKESLSDLAHMVCQHMENRLDFWPGQARYEQMKAAAVRAALEVYIRRQN